MKMIHTSVLLPVILGGCSLSHTRQNDTDARQFVDAQISIQLQRIALSQKSLQQTAQTAPPKAPPSTKVSSPVVSQKTKSPEAPAVAADSLRGLSSIKSLGTPEPFTVVSVNARNLSLEPTLRAIVPPSWNTVISADLKRKFTATLSLSATDQWPYVLDKLLQQNGWVALVEWPKKTVSVAYRTSAFSTTPMVISPPAIQPAAGQTGTKAVATRQSSSMASRDPFSSSRTKVADSRVKPPATPATPLKAAVPTAAAAKVWRAEQGSTLEDTLNLWAADEKCSGGQNGTWSVMWLTKVNYRIDAPLSFSGSYKDALNGIFRLYSTASVPLYAGISTPQCLLKVDDKEVK